MSEENDEWSPDDSQIMTIEESLKKTREDKDQHKPHKESEVLLIKPLQIRLRNRETPKGQIECPIGDTVKPTFCKKCAYACDCQSYENYLNARISKLREFYWKIRSKISEWLDYIYANITGEY